jgi:uncharacterized protein YjbI with pentapeptide repeats
LKSKPELYGKYTRQSFQLGAFFSAADYIQAQRVRPLLRQVSRQVRDRAGDEQRELRGAVLAGAALRGADLRAADLSGACLIGADLRDADLRGADLTGALFLTRPQLASTRTDSATRLP